MEGGGCLQASPEEAEDDNVGDKGRRSQPGDQAAQPRARRAHEGVDVR